MEFYCAFFLPPAKKEERNPTHIALIAKALRANAEAKGLSKSAILPTLTVQLDNFILFFEINLYFS